MSNQPKICQYKTLNKVATRLRDDLNNHDFVLLYAYNGTGKTRLSMAFKDQGKRRGQRDTFYFNAYTEDLFSWDNDLQDDATRILRINSASRFFSGLRELALEEKISSYLSRYATVDFKIDYEKWAIMFSRGNEHNIKISRGEENIFIWCIFLAIVQLVIDDDGTGPYHWVKYIYIDDPISSLDDNNAIAVASDLSQLLQIGGEKIKTVISSHHGLFFNVMWNEFKRSGKKHKTYFYNYLADSDKYTLQTTGETPFLHHVAILHELQQAVKTEKLYTYHFNMLRSILEKTATFFGLDNFSECLQGVDDRGLYARALNLLSHGKYSVYEPREMVADNKELFKKILSEFLGRYAFKLPEITAHPKRQTERS
ncbi:MAG: AAA family ATPase [Candidatus Adiutrix sp.]|nr:AAA family ATPase [Candidatus Adiutrix sp.]